MKSGGKIDAILSFLQNAIVRFIMRWKMSRSRPINAVAGLRFRHWESRSNCVCRELRKGAFVRMVRQNHTRSSR